MIIPRETPVGIVMAVSEVHPAIAAEPFVIMIKYDVIIKFEYNHTNRGNGCWNSNGCQLQTALKCRGTLWCYNDDY